MSTSSAMLPQVPTISDDVLQQLILWVRGFLQHKHKRGEPESEASKLSLDLWTGFELALTELWALRQRELIDWHDVTQQLPDADITVLICIPYSDEPVWLGWFDGTDWYEVGGGAITDVVRWAHMPAGGISNTSKPT